MKKPILVILVILINFGNGIKAATTDFINFNPACFKLESRITSATENNPKVEKFVDNKLRLNQCVENFLIPTECL